MKLRIGPRMVAGFLFMSFLLIITGIFAIVYLNRVQESSSRILAENVSSLKAAEELEIALLDMKGLTGYFLLDGNENWLTNFAEKNESFDKWFSEAQKGALTPEEKKIIREIETLFAAYIKYHTGVVTLFRQGRQEQAHAVLTGEMRSTFLLIYEKCEEYLSLNEKLMLDANHLIEAENRTARYIIYGVASIGILVGIFLGILLARSITKPIYELVLKVKGASNGELFEKVDIENETELDHLDRHVRDLIDKTYEVNRDLEQSRKRLIQSEKLAALGQLAAGIAHEIYNPLTAIKMLLFSLQQGLSLDAQKTKDLEVITKEIGRMERFIQNFLQFARPHESYKSSLNINDLIRNTLALLAPQISSSQIQIEEDLLSSIPQIYADSEQLQQILVNIILNSLQAMPEGGKLKIETCLNHKSHPGSKQSLQIIIRDTGKGIPREVLKNMFDPFVTTKSKGVGLGLSISYQIAKQHGGWIEGVNNPGKGATFIINLPLQKEDVYEKNSGN